MLSFEIGVSEPFYKQYASLLDSYVLWDGNNHHFRNHNYITGDFIMTIINKIVIIKY